jgi:hypothetical protein
MSGEKQVDCSYCDREKLSKDEIGLNKKLIRSQVKKMMCITCLAGYFEMAEEDLEELIDRFKRQGCTLFG